MRIDHINIAAPMSLLDEVRKFYCTALQLEEGPRPDFGIRGYWLYGGGRPIVHLIESDDRHPAEKPPYLDHVAFEVTGLSAYMARLKSLGVEYSVNHIEDFNISQVFCKDPCGNGVEANFANEKADVGGPVT
jgi:catechol 2,3-dioxygenase-like lactoylglutathione lyase family enzyme